MFICSYEGAFLHRLHVPVALVEETDLTWTQATSFPRVHWQLSLWQESGLEMGQLEPEAVWARASPLPSGQHHPTGTGAGSGSQDADTEALRFRAEWAPFLLSVCSLPSQENIPALGGRSDGGRKAGGGTWSGGRLLMGLLICCLCESENVWPLLRCHFGSELLLCLTAEISFNWVHPGSCVELHCDTTATWRHSSAAESRLPTTLSLVPLTL